MRSNSISSISSISSRSSSAEAEETTQVFIKNIAGDTFPLQVPRSTTIATLKSLLAIRTNLPPRELRLVHAGRHITDPDSTLSDHAIGNESTLHLALPIRGGAPKKIRCQAKDCRDAAQRIVGDCGFCQGHFCGKHRMLESHSCAGLQSAREEERQRNTDRLEKERTIAIKGI
ncbi:hypothetical protein LTR66_009733 [Elasticomyces elasticus]|nr:hypothetical protein LTR28_009980 [Elasticomyces elasticus]KAK4981757.1 hypothetical protein LTR66_009733 [Elasticomyces elasticus]